MTYQLSKKEFYSEPLGTSTPVSEEMVREAYLVFACRHKFCRDICPVFDVTRNEGHTSYGHHTAILALSRGIDSFDNLAEDFTYCLECGACEIRCPNTAFGGEFYRRTTTTVDLVRKIRRDQVAAGKEFANWAEVTGYLDEHRALLTTQEDLTTKWAVGMKLAKDMRTALFVDFFSATQGTEVPRLAASILAKLSVKCGVYASPGVSAPELLSADFDEWKRYAQANVDAFRALGVRTLVVMNPHDHALLCREYPKWFDMDGIEVVFVTDFIARKMVEKDYHPMHPVEGRVAYHDPCTLNKLVIEPESPRMLLEAIPGLEMVDVMPSAQWRYCCGNGNGPFRKLHPDVAYLIGQKRLHAASDLGAAQIVVACPHCKDQFAEVRAKSGIQVEAIHVLEVLAQSMGIE